MKFADKNLTWIAGFVSQYDTCAVGMLGGVGFRGWGGGELRVAVAMEIGELISVCNTARRFKQNQDLDVYENRYTWKGIYCI